MFKTLFNLFSYFLSRRRSGQGAGPWAGCSSQPSSVADVFGGGRFKALMLKEKHGRERAEGKEEKRKGGASKISEARWHKESNEREREHIKSDRKHKK